jgi:hypothetical protein
MDSNGLTQEERDQLEQEELEEEEQDQMDDGNGGAQMEEEEDEEEGSPEDGGANMGQGMTTDEYEEIDYKICGELGKNILEVIMLGLEEKNRALDDFAQT